MLRSVLKYESKAVARYFKILLVTLPILSVVTGILFRMISATVEIDRFILLSVMGMFLFITCMIAIFGSAIVTPILLYIRFYQNFFTDEGYLTFTLPVSRRKLLLGKTINSMRYILAHVGLLLLCSLILLLIIPIPEYGIISVSGFVAIGKFIAEMWKMIGAWFFVYLLEILLAIVISEFFSIALTQFCITVGAIIAKKHKIIASIGIYYATNSALSLLLQLLGSIATLIMLDGFIELLTNAASGIAHSVIALIIMIVLLIVAGISFVLYFITQDLLDRRLNLQ